MLYKSSLAIDTSAEYVSAALAVENSGVTRHFAISALAGTSHSELLFDMIDSLFKLSGTEREKIEAVAVMRGPGSWTGLRIGYAAAQGILVASGARIVTVPTLDCAAFPYSDFDGTVLAVFDAKQKRFFCKAFLHGRNLTEPLDVSVETIIELLAGTKNVLLTGNGAALFLEKINFINQSDIKFMLDPYFQCGRAPQMITYLEHNPHICNEGDTGLLYLRASDAEINSSINNKTSA